MRMFYLFSCAMLFCIGCTHDQSSSSTFEIDERLGVDSVISLDFLSNLESEICQLNDNKQDTTVIVHIDGECSSCIAAFLNFLNVMHLNRNFQYIYMVEAFDLQMVEYYIEQQGRILHKNEFLVLDEKSYFHNSNPRVVLSLLPFIVVHRNGKVINAISLYDIKN